jgi:hypothetical protein
MPNESVSSVQQKAVDELLENVSTASDPGREIIKFILAQTREKDPQLADAIYFSAIPRRINAEIIGVLRQAPEDPTQNVDLLSRLLRFSFMHPRPDGDFVYDDSTREILLDEWRSAGSREQFDMYNRLLEDYYQTLYEDAKQVDNDLELVGWVIKRANPERFFQLAPIVERQLLVPLLEALYHAILRSPEDGYSLFDISFQEYESRDRLTICGSLQRAAHDYLEALPTGSGQEPWLKWMQYWKARLKGDLRKYEEAMIILRELLPTIQDDIKLQLWTMGDLVSALHQQYKLLEARQEGTQLLALAKESLVDPYNLPVWQSTLAGIHWSLEELEGAAGQYREAVQSAREQRNLGMEIYSYLNLSGVLQDQGKLEDALEAALEAFHLVRLKEWSDTNPHQALAKRFMQLFAQVGDTRLLDTTYLESRKLLSDLGDPLRAFELRNLYANMLRSSWQHTRAEQELAELQEEAAPSANQPFNLELMLRKAMLHDDQGRLGDVLDIYGEMIAQSDPPTAETLSYRAIALTNRGMVAEMMARWKEAASELHAARQMWQEVGHDKLVALIQIGEAAAARRKGQLVEAQNLLDQANKSLRTEITLKLAAYHQAQADLHRDQAQWPDAHQEYQQALAILRPLQQLDEAALVLGNLANIASQQADWQAAQQYSADAQVLWRQLAEREKYHPTQAALRGDEDNAKGIQKFASLRGDRRENLENAYYSFKHAIRRVPGNWWYRLNWAYACAALEWWKEAAQGIEAALEKAPASMRHPILYQRMVDFILAHGKSLADDNQYKASAQYYASSLERLASRVPFDRLAEVWLGLGDSLLTQLEWDKAREEYTNGLLQAEAAEVTNFQAAFHARLGYLDAIRANISSARDHFWHSLALYTQRSPETGAQDLVNDISNLVVSGQQFYTFSEALRVLAQDTRLDAQSSRALRAAGLEYSRSNYPRLSRPASLRASGADFDFTPFSTPIVLEADDRLFPHGAETPEVVRMLDKDKGDILAMRTRIEESSGVWIPYIRLRGNLDLMDGSYVLKLHDVPLAKGQVMTGHKYCPDATAIRTLGLQYPAVPNPNGQGEGIWLSNVTAELAQSAGLPLWDVYQFMLYHLEALIHSQLTTFLGVQEVYDQLMWWQSQDGLSQSLQEQANAAEIRIKLFQKVYDNPETRIRLVQVLQGLVKEGIPVNDFDAILPAFIAAQSQSTELMNIVERVRMAVRADLPGNDESREWLSLPEDFESLLARWVWERDGKRFLAMPPADLESFRGILARVVGDRPGRKSALVVNDPLLRPFIYLLIERQFPNMAVISERELLIKTPGSRLKKRHARRLKRIVEIKGKQLDLNTRLRSLRGHTK